MGMGNKVFPGLGGLIQLGFAIICFHFTYSVPVYASFIMFKILVMALHNNNISKITGLRIIVIYYEYVYLYSGMSFIAW